MWVCTAKSWHGRGGWPVARELKAAPDGPAMNPAGMHRRFQFVSRIAAGDTEKEGPAGQRGSLFKGFDSGLWPSPLRGRHRLRRCGPIRLRRMVTPRGRLRLCERASRRALRGRACQTEAAGLIPPGEGWRGGSGSASLRAGATRSVALDGGRCCVTSSYRGAVRRSCSPPARRAGASVARSTRYAATRAPRLTRPAPLARRRGVLP